MFYIDEDIPKKGESIMENDKTKLIFRVEKPIWLASTGPEKFEIIGWTSKKPTYDNGYIEKNTVLVFSHLYEDALNFMMLRSEDKFKIGTAEFFEKELDSLTKEKTLTLLDSKDVDEISIVLGGIYIRHIEDESFESPIILPKDIYVVMGNRDAVRSQRKIKTGEKISLRHILDIYDDVVGRDLIPK